MSEPVTLRTPFPPGQVGKLPRIVCPRCRESRGKVCDEHVKSKCGECDQFITGRHIHLDYVGHAAVTDRLLTVDPGWTWEPVAFDPHGAPLVQQSGGEATMWIRLTVDGVTRLGVGSCQAGSLELHKQLISDAIRNAAMRFGVALDLWAKEGLQADDPPEPASDSWEGLGWASQAAHDAALEVVRAQAKKLDPGRQETLRGWLRDQGWSLPYTAGQMGGWQDRVEELAEEALLAAAPV